MLRSAVGKSISEYLYEKIWEPIGAEGDAAWLVDSHGIEVAHAFFNQDSLNGRVVGGLSTRKAFAMMPTSGVPTRVASWALFLC